MSSAKKPKFTHKNNELYQELLKQLSSISAFDDNPLYSQENVQRRLEKKIQLRVTSYTVMHDGVAVAHLKDTKMVRDQQTVPTRSLNSIINDKNLRQLSTEYPVDLTNPEIQQQTTLHSSEKFEAAVVIPYRELFEFTQQLQGELFNTETKISEKIASTKKRLQKKFPDQSKYFEESTPETVLEAKFKKTIRTFIEAIESVESHSSTRNDELRRIIERKAAIISEIDTLLLDTDEKLKIVRAFEADSSKNGGDFWTRMRVFSPFTRIPPESYQQLRVAMHDISPKESILLTREHQIDARRASAGYEIGSRGEGPFQHDVESLKYLQTLTAFQDIAELPTKPIPRLDDRTGDLLFPQEFGPHEVDVKSRFFDLLKQIAYQDQLYLHTLLGDTYLDLFHRIADENLFGPDNENMFVDQYTLMIMFSSMVGNYNPLRIDRQLAKILLIDTIQKRRARDPELSAKRRNLPIEVMVTAMSGASDMLGIPGTSDHFTELTKRFWWLEVGRQDLIFEKNELIEEENQIAYDSLGRPIVEGLMHHENLGSDLSSEYGKYVWRRAMNENSKALLHTKNQDEFISNVVFRQLEAMRDGRREHPDGKPKKPAEMGITEVPLPTNDDYFVVVTIGNLWKKIKVPNAYFKANDSISHSIGLRNSGQHMELRSSFHSYLQEQIKRNDDGDGSIDPSWQLIPTDGVAKAYEKTDGHTESYQDQKHRLSDFSDYTSAHLRIALVEDVYLNSAEELQNSILTCTFSGRTQQTLLLGFKDGKYERAAAGISHRNIDGQNTRAEAASTFEKAFEDTVGSHLFRLLRLKQCIDDKKPIQAELETMHHKLEKAASAQAISPSELIEKTLTAIRNQNTKSTEYQSLIEAEQAPKVETEYDSRIIDGVIPESMRLRARADAIFAFYNKKFGMHPDKNVLTQFAMMMTMDREDSHFLESDEGILCPTLSLLPKSVQEAIKACSRDPDDIFRALAFSEVMKMDRLSVSKGRGVIRVLAMLSGAHGASMTERQVITVMGKMLNNKVTDPLTSSVLLSAVSGTREALPKGLVDDQDMFTTALEEVYPHGAWALSDIDEDITFSYRCLRESPFRKKWNNSEEFAEEFIENLELILTFFENGFVEADNLPPSVFGGIPDQSEIAKLLPAYKNEQRQSWRTTAWRKRWNARQKIKT